MDKLSKILYVAFVTLLITVIYTNPLGLLMQWGQEFRWYTRHLVDEEVSDFLDEASDLYLDAEQDLTRALVNSVKWL